MKKSTLSLFPVLLALLLACNNEQKAERSAIQSQEEAVETEATPENVQALIQHYQYYRDSHPEDNTFNPRYLYREAALHYRMAAFGQAANLLKTALREYPKADINARTAYMLGAIYKEEMRNPEPAFTIFQTMQQAFPNDSLTVKAQGELPNDIQPVDQRLDHLRKSIFTDSTGRINYRQANDYLNSAELYALLLPAADESPTLLYQAGEIARSIRDYTLALRLYSILYERYPEHKNAPKALFMEAFTYDDNLKQFDKARERYEAFLEAHPDDDFADDAQVLLENLGKNDEEIIDNLIKKGQPATE